MLMQPSTPAHVPTPAHDAQESGHEVEVTQPTAAKVESQTETAVKAETEAPAAEEESVHDKAESKSEQEEKKPAEPAMTEEKPAEEAKEEKREVCWSLGLDPVLELGGTYVLMCVCVRRRLLVSTPLFLILRCSRRRPRPRRVVRSKLLTGTKKLRRNRQGELSMYRASKPTTENQQTRRKEVDGWREKERCMLEQRKHRYICTV